MPGARSHPTAAQVLGRRLLGHGSVYAMVAASGLAFALVQLAVVTRLLDREAFGHFAILYFFAAVVALVASLGVLQGTLASGFSGGMGGDDEDPVEEDERRPTAVSSEDNRRRLTSGLVTVLLFGAVLVGASAMLAPDIERVLLGDTGDGAAVVWATLYGGLGPAWRLMIALPRFERRPGRVAALQVLRHVLTTAGAIAGGTIEPGLAGVLGGMALGLVLAIAVGFGLSRHRFALALSARDVTAAGRRGRPLAAISLVFFLTRNADLFLLSRYVPASELGVYQVAGRVGLIPSYAVAATLYAWGPLVRGPLRAALESDQSLDAARGRLVTYYVLLCAATLVGVTLLADVLVGIVPATYGRAAELVPLLAVAAGVHGGFIIVYRMSRFPRRRRAFVLAGLVGLALTVGIGVVLIPRFGATGAAVTSIAAPFFALLLMVWRSQRGPEPLPLDGRRLAATLALAATWVAAGEAAAALLPQAAARVADVVLVVTFLVLVLTVLLPAGEARKLRRLLTGRRAAAASERQARTRLAERPAEDRDLVEALLQRGETPAATATRLGEPEDVLLRRLVAILREVGEIGTPSRADERIGRYLTTRRSSGHRDQLGHRLGRDARLSALEVEHLAMLADGLRRGAADR